MQIRFRRLASILTRHRNVSSKFYTTKTAKILSKFVLLTDLSFGRSLSFALVQLSAKPRYQLTAAKRFQFTMTAKKKFERLPKIVVPINYDITLKPDLEKFDFNGSEVVKVKVNETTNKIVLHAIELKFQAQDISFSPSGSQAAFPCSGVDFSSDDETATLNFGTELPPGEGELTIKFVGNLNEKMKGFFRSKYTLNDVTKYTACTQFEATEARRAFPCWDEPAIKATFGMTLIVPKNRVALSNMNVVEESAYDLDPDWKVVKFAPSPIMSTYLVACMVGEYDYVEDKTEDGVLVRVYTPVGKQEQGMFSLNVATKVLPYYKKYFNIDYPLPKLDLIGGGDFSGAMENWGLITFRESCLLVDPKNTSANSKQWVALFVGHEIAHQWFGNIVTMEWWTHLWLNEGFASWIEFLCVDYLFPEYDIWSQFVSNTYIHALELDALKNSHPIEVTVGHPSEVDEIFDDISYNKGASVIRMLHSYIGDEDFRKGMHHYLDKHKYSNTFTEDLWDSLEYGSGKPIRGIMSSWTQQVGYPVLKVTINQNGSSKVLTVSQERFLADGSTDKQMKWMVPINFSCSRDPKKVIKQIVLDSESTDVVFDDIRPEEWIKLNPGTVGYYRCQYPPEVLLQFFNCIKDKTLPPLDRLGMLDDLFAMVQAGHVPTTEVLTFLEAFTKEDSYTVWSSINNCLGRLSVLLSHTDSYELFKSFGIKILSDVAERLGWDAKPNESHLDAMLRSLVYGRIGPFGDQKVIEEAKKRFQGHLTGEADKQIPVDLKSAVYRTVLSVGDENTYEAIIKLYRETDLQEEKDRLAQSLGAMKDQKLLEKILHFALTDEVRSTDTVYIIVSVSSNPRGREMAWNFFKERCQDFQKKYDGGWLLCRLVMRLTENFRSEEKAQEVENFFKEHSFPGTERTVLQAIENIRLNERWLARDSEGVKQWLEKNYK